MCAGPRLQFRAGRAWSNYVALCPLDIRSAKRRRKFAVSATSGVSGVMEGSVMNLAFLNANPEAPRVEKNALRSFKARFRPTRAGSRSRRLIRRLGFQVVFQIGGGKNRAPTADRT